MPRIARKLTESGYYHIMMRGVERRHIYIDENDYNHFLFLIRKYTLELNIDIVTYCLMPNHFHLLIKTDEMDIFVKKLASAYVKYFNAKYQRVGHLFQERFKSEIVEDDSYLLTVTRYILRNPQKARIANYNEYQWNNWSEFINAVFCNTSTVIKLAGGFDNFIEFMENDNRDRCLEFNEFKYMDTEEIVNYILLDYKLDSIDSLKNFSREKVVNLIRELKKDGLMINQIAVATGIDRNIIQRA